MMPNERRELANSNKEAGAGRRYPTNSPTTARAALKASDTSKRKPVHSTSANDTKRFLITQIQRLSGLGLTLQILLSALCSSVNAPEAPSSTAPMPRALAMAPTAGRFAL